MMLTFFKKEALNKLSESFQQFFYQILKLSRKLLNHICRRVLR